MFCHCNREVILERAPWCQALKLTVLLYMGVHLSIIKATVSLPEGLSWWIHFTSWIAVPTGHTLSSGFSGKIFKQGSSPWRILIHTPFAAFSCPLLFTDGWGCRDFLHSHWDTNWGCHCADPNPIYMSNAKQTGQAIFIEYNFIYIWSIFIHLCVHILL